MKKTKRLFLFAGYDKDGIIDDTLVHYLTELSKLGDIVLVMDCNVNDTTKLNGIKNLLHTELLRHNEYDFGSYKRAYMWAHNKKILSKYDWIYLVNDSVYGPLFDVEHILCDLESRGVDLIGMTDFTDAKTALHAQSWFIGMSKKLATEPFVKNFIEQVTYQSEKDFIILKYEVGLSQMILQHGYRMSTYIIGQDGDISHDMYMNPLLMLKNGLPFIKKAALPQIQEFMRLYQFTSDTIFKYIRNHAQRNGIDIQLKEKVCLFQQHHRLRYEKCFRFTLLSIPLVTIYKQQQPSLTNYKLYIADKIPMLKVMVKNSD